jgi:hypothetical protein
MKGRQFLIILAVCVSIAFASCTTFQADGIQMGFSTNGTEILGDFTTKVYINKFLGESGGTNLFNISSNATSGPIRTAIEKEISKKGGTAAINISVKYGSNPLQWWVNGLTGKIWAPSTVTITGTVIKQN